MLPPQGLDVTLVSSRDRVLPGEDADASAVLEDVLVRQGIAYQVIGGPKFYERARVRPLSAEELLAAAGGGRQAACGLDNNSRRPERSSR